MTGTINIAGILPNSMSNGPGMRYVLFTQGCNHHCDGCQNPHTWELGIGKEMTVTEILDDIKNNIPIIRGITLSGGDPMEQAEGLWHLCNAIKYELNLNIWCYTGYTYEEIMNSKDEYKIELLKYIDVLVDGPFKKDFMKDAPVYAGSSNQRIIHLTNGERIR